MFKKITTNATINFGGKIIATFLGLIAVALMTRYLGTAGFGKYTTIIAFLQFFGILADLGLTLITAQMLAKYPHDQDRVISNLFTLRLFSALVFLGLAPLAVLFMPYEPIIKTGVLIAVISFFFIALNQILIGLYQKKLQMGKATIAEVSSRAFLVLAILIAVYYDTGLLGIVVATVSVAVINFLINYLFSLKIVKIRFAFDRQIFKEILKLSWPLAITITFNLIYLKADILIMSLMRSQSEVGLYGAAYRVIDVLVILPFVLAGIILPQLTKSWFDNNREQFKKLIQYSFDIMVILALPLVIGAQFAAKPLMVLVAGREFTMSGTILKILIFACGIIYLGTVFSHVIIAIEKQKQTIWVYVFAAATALIGYLIFIPRYSYFGAAGVTIYSEVLVAVLVFAVYYKHTHFLPNCRNFLRALFASIIMSVFLYFAQNLNIIITLIFAIAIYVAVLFPLAKKDIKNIYAKS